MTSYWYRFRASQFWRRVVRSIFFSRRVMGSDRIGGGREEGMDGWTDDG